MLQLPHIKARIARLNELTRGLAKEAAVWKMGEDPLLYLERKQYLNAMMNALAGLEEARVVLVGAARRLDRRRGESLKPGS